MRHAIHASRFAGALACAWAFASLLMASGCGSRPIGGTSLLVRPHGKQAETMREHLASAAASRGFVLVEAVPMGSAACYQLDYSCEALPSGKRQPPRAAIDATMTDARSGGVVYRDRIVCAAPNGLEAAVSTAEGMLLDEISRVR